jgi:hypothetical protein
MERTSDNTATTRIKQYTMRFEENKFGCKPMKWRALEHDLLMLKIAVCSMDQGEQGLGTVDLKINQGN